MAYPDVRSSSSGEGNGAGSPAQMPITLPAPITAGDTLIIVFAADGYDEPYAGTSGFTRLTWDYNTGQDVTLAVFWKKATGSEDGTTVNLEGVSLQYAYTVYCFQDASDPTITPPSYSAITEGADGTAEIAICDPGVSDDYYWLACAACDRRAFSGYPADMTLNRLAAGTSSILNASVATAGKKTAAADYTPTGTFTLSSADEWLTCLICIPPYTAAPVNINLTGPIVASSSIQGDLGIVYDSETPVPVTAATAILELYDSTTDTWTDITPYLRSWSVVWGASGMLEQVRARIATFILDNNDRRFEPRYTLSPYYEYLTVGSYIYFNLKVSTPGGDTVYPLFYGVAQAWRPTYSTPPARDAICVLEACDPNLIIANDLCTLSLPAETADLMIHDLLAARKWSGNISEDFETGDSTLQTYDVDHEPILTVINRIVDSEGGWFYWQPGIRKITARFLNRHYLSQQDETETVYVLSDIGQGGQYTGIVLGSDDDHLYTRAMLTRVDGTTQTYLGLLATPLGERTYTASNLLLATDSEVADRAMYIVESRARAIYNLYCTQIRTVLALKQSVEHSVNVLGLTQPFAPVVIIHQPTTGGALAFACRVVGGSISQREAGGLIEIVGNMVDAAVIGGDFWILQDAVKGVLGTTTVLGW